MSSFHFSKIITGVGPTLAKETVLSKIIHMVDIFRVSLGGGFDDNNKKYIDTIMKLDHSKTILLETRGIDFRVKNVIDTKIKEKQVVELEYSEYAQENNHKIFIDANFLGELPVGQIITFEQSGIQLKVKSTIEDGAMCEALTGGEITQYDKVIFENFEAPTPIFSERDKKDILRGLEYGAHVIGASMIKTPQDILEIREFLATQSADKMKVFAKIENADALKNIKEIIESSDGIIFVFEKLQTLLKEQNITAQELIQLCKKVGKPVIVTFSQEEKKDKKQEKGFKYINEKELEMYAELSVDCIMTNTFLKEEDSLETATYLSTRLEKREEKHTEAAVNEDFYNQIGDQVVRDYIIFNAYRITQELEIKAIVSFTENGYTAARLSSLKPRIPVISFTKTDETYRYLNMLWGVRGYKISPSFNYENLKRVGKEMIRIIFKGNISLDDKIIIVQANEIIKDEKTGMINGLELYKFKNI